MSILPTTRVYAGANAAGSLAKGSTKVWPPNPASFTGLVVWLDASQLPLANGASVSPWPNLGSGPPGTMLGTPLPVVRTNALNGLPVVRFTFQGGRIRMTGNGIDKDWTLVYVARRWGINNARFICSNNDAGFAILVGHYGTSMDAAYDGTWSVPNPVKPATTAWKMYSADGASTPTYTPRYFIDGTLAGTVAAGGKGWAGYMYISGYQAAGLSDVGDIEVAEVCFYNRKLTDPERQQVESYLRGKWGALS